MRHDKDKSRAFMENQISKLLNEIGAGAVELTNMQLEFSKDYWIEDNRCNSEDNGKRMLTIWYTETQDAE